MEGGSWSPAEPRSVHLAGRDELCGQQKTEGSNHRAVLSRAAADTRACALAHLRKAPLPSTHHARRIMVICSPLSSFLALVELTLPSK